MLMNVLGEAKFWQCCKAYLQEYGHKNVTTEQFFTSWEKSSKMDLLQFKQPWFYTKGVPKIKVSRQDNGDWVVESVNKAFAKTLAVKLQFLDEDGVSHGTIASFENGPFTMGNSKSKTLIVDPGAWIMCDIEYPAYSDDQWVLAWKSAENAAQKMRLMDKITANDRSLMRIWNWERSKAVKSQLIPHLKEPALLVDLLAHTDEKIVRLAMNRLNALKDPTIGQVANRIFSTTANESLKNNAYQILLELKNDQATADLGWKTTTYNMATRTAALNWYATNQPNTARKIALDAVINYAPGPVRMAAIGVLGRVKDEPGKREVFNVLVEIAKGRPYSPMSAAINALAAYGDKAAIPIIESRKNHSLHFGRGLVAGALARLSK